MKNRKIMSEMNVVPYIDVMLVLLIIFMLTAPVMNKSIDINMPEVKDGDGYTVVDKEMSIVFIKANGEVYLNDKKIKIENIGDFIKDKKEVINVASDTSLTYGDLVKKMEVLKENGYHNISLVLDIIKE